jgi:hypothetical protein
MWTTLLSTDALASAHIGLAVPGRPSRSLVAEDRIARGVRTRREPPSVGPCRVRSRRVNRGQQRAGVVTRRSMKPQVAPPTAS